MKRSACLFTVVGALCATPVLAASSATATLGPLMLELVDLDLGDGIAPSVTFLDNNSIVGAGVSRGGIGDSNQGVGASAFDPGSVSALLAGVQSTAFIGGSGTAFGSSFTASGSAADFIGPVGDSARFVAQASTPIGGGIGIFVLSAQTQLTISASATITAQGTGASGNPSPGGDNVSANVYISLTADSDALDYFNSSDGLTGFDFSETRTLSVTAFNPTAADLLVRYGISTSVSGDTFASAVPEPAAAVTLLTGLAALSVYARRRRG